MPPLVSVISCALNQGDWVRNTVPLIRSSLGDWPHEILIVDDQSTDGCCHGLPKEVSVIRTPARYGVSASRRLAVRVAQGGVFLFTDPHCHYPGPALRDLVQCAVDKQAICLPRTTSHPKVSRARNGGVLTKSERGLKVSYALRAPAPWPALLGTIYAIQRPLYDHLGGWPELPGVWGYSEQALTLMAWFSGVPIHVDTRHVCNHEHYHPTNDQGQDRFNYHVSLQDNAANGHWVHSAYFPQTYDVIWSPILKKRFGDKPHHWDCLGPRGWESKDPGVGRRTIEKFRYEISLRAVRTEEDFYRLVLQEPVPNLPGPERPIYQTDPAFVAHQRTRSKPGMDYDSVHRRQDRAVQWFIRHLPGCLKGRRILDLGSRCGYLVDRMTAAGALHVEGVELVPDTAEYARKELKRNVRQGDMRGLPDADNSWHCVTCVHALEHVPDPANALAEMLRVLIPNGWLFIVVPIEETPKRREAHYYAFPNEQALLDLLKPFKVDRIQTEVLGLAPKPRKEILLLCRKR